MSEATVPAARRAAKATRRSIEARTLPLWVCGAFALIAPTGLAFSNGGTRADAQLLCLAVGCATLLVAVVLGPWPPVPGGAAAVALAALAGLAAWTTASVSWARIEGPAADDAGRVLLYVAVFAAALMAMRVERLRQLAPGVLLAGIVAVTAYSLGDRLLPGLVHLRTVPVAGARLSEPVGYWNGMAMLAATGSLLGVGIAGVAGRAIVRGAACSAAALCGFALLLTFSRGALIALLAGSIVLALALLRRSVLLAAAIAYGTAGALGLLLRAFPAVLDLDEGRSEQGTQGALLTPIAIVAIVGAGVAFALLARSPRAAGGLAIPVRVRAVAGVGTVVAVLALGAVVAFGAERTETTPTSAKRLTTLHTTRGDYWRVALGTFADHPAAGVGASSFEVEWRRERPSSEYARDAHSLYIETLSELGIVGGLLLGVFLAAVATGAVRRARERPGDSVLAIAAGLLAAYAVHAGLDWDWEVPAVTLPVLVLAAAALQPPPSRA